MNPPPPRFPASGQVTARTNATATAASTALPPRFMMSAPTRDAIASTEATMTCGSRTGRREAACNGIAIRNRKVMQRFMGAQSIRAKITCMRRLRILALGLSLITVGANAQITQVTFVKGDTLSQLISNLYGGNGIDLAHTGHEAHFGETRDFQNFSDTLQAALQSRSFIPVPSSVGLVSY